MRPVRLRVLGAVSALGATPADSFDQLANGESRFGVPRRFDASDAPRLRTAEVLDVDTLDALVERLLPSERLSVDRAYLATSADFAVPSLPETVDVPGRTWDRIYSGACVASSSAVIDAAAAVAHGWADSVLVLGARVLDEPTVRLFDAGGALTHVLPRPMGRGSDGVLLGEGGAALLVEADAHADSIEIAGWGRAGDAHHAFQPDPDGSGMARSVRRALEIAALPPTSVDVISVHGTGTALSDASEHAALEQVFGRANAIPSTHAPKGATGHLLEAAGAHELALLAQSLRAQVAPRSPGVLHGEGRFPGVATRSQRRRLDHGLTMNLAFGGSNTAIVASRVAVDAPVQHAHPAAAPLEVRCVARVGAVSDYPRLSGFMLSTFPAALHDAARRALERSKTATTTALGVLIIVPNGDAETRAAGDARVRAGQRLPPPLFVQGAPTTVIGRIMVDFGLTGSVHAFSDDWEVDEARTRQVVAELVQTDGLDGMLVLRHRTAADGGSSVAEAAVHHV